jgi:hypothetical protein
MWPHVNSVLFCVYRCTVQNEADWLCISWTNKKLNNIRIHGKKKKKKIHTVCYTVFSNSQLIPHSESAEHREGSRTKEGRSPKVQLHKPNIAQ